MGNDGGTQILPVRVDYAGAQRRGQRRRWHFVLLTFLVLFAVGSHIHLAPLFSNQGRRSVQIPLHAAETTERCLNLRMKPGPSPTFNNRSASDRFVLGTKPTLIKNATIWTGRVKGLEILKGDILLANGIIKQVGKVLQSDLDAVGKDIATLDAGGSWVTPGIVDLHSHLGVDSVPELRGANDGNSRKSTILPWLRALDGLNTHDDAYQLSISGGVTTALVLPGSANAIGGQAFPIKLRDTQERTPTSKLLEPTYTLNGTHIDWSLPPRWRHMKHACGENPMRVYGATRMDNLWAMREAYNHARIIKEKQDGYCAKVLADDWAALGDEEFPEDLQWEAMVDILRGRFKVNVHCYETVDLDDIVRLTNEFQFPIAAFHHAHETYLVPDTLKKAYGNAPASAIFATNARYKREAFRGSEYAARILADNGLKVVMKSDHPVLNSRYLLYEAQQAHYYGLTSNYALASVTSTPAEVMGMDHRIGFIKQGYDADVVVWDSHPLALGATPKQVFIDGIAQLDHPFVSSKPASYQRLPITPDFDQEARDAVTYEGLPPLLPNKARKDVVVFTNVSEVFVRGGEGNVRHLFTTQGGDRAVAVVREGRLVCSGLEAWCASHLSNVDADYVDLKGGAVQPALVSFGSDLGLEEIQGERSTYDGNVNEPVLAKVPELLEDTVIHAADGLQFTTRNALLGYRAGVSYGVTAPQSRGFFSGVSTAFSLGATHKLQKGAVVQADAALHVSVHYSGSPSVSTQITALRKLLLESQDGETGSWFKRVVDGEIPLVVQAQSADVISTLILLKREVEKKTGKRMQLTISSALESGLVAKELGEAGVGVILVPSRPFPNDWESRRIIPGPPLTKQSLISHLIAHNVTVGIGIEEGWSARNTRFDAAWAALEAPDLISRTEALALASTNLEKLLGVQVDDGDADLVATEGGGLLDMEGKVVAMISPRRGVTDLL